MQGRLLLGLKDAEAREGAVVLLVDAARDVLAGRVDAPFDQVDILESRSCHRGLDERKRLRLGVFHDLLV